MFRPWRICRSNRQLGDPKPKTTAMVIAAISEHVERLVQAGACMAWRADNVRGSSVTRYDPEGNKFRVT